MTLKCIFTENEDGWPPRCNQEAEYVYQGKSYCAEHLEKRADENRILILLEIAQSKPK